MRKALYLLFFLSIAFYSCDSSSDNVTDETELPDNGGDGGTTPNPDQVNYLTPEVDADGKIIVTYTPKEYVTKVEEGQHMMSVRIPKDYYTSASSLSGTELRNHLKTIISNDAKSLSYAVVWTMCEEGDQNPADASQVWRIYKESGIAKEDRVSYVSYGWNREHVWSKANGGFDTSIGPGTDGHHLRASDAGENGKRGNLLFADVNGPRTSGGGYYEPPLSAKGDVARMCFYMAIRYGLSIDKNAKLSDLLEWNELDPVDPYEIRRNNVIYGYQNNRNPFIDHPELVKYIFGEKKTAVWED